MAAALISGAHTIRGFNSNGVVTLPINTAGANFIVFAVFSYALSQQAIIFDSKNNFWFATAAYIANDIRVKTYYALPLDSGFVGQNHTFTATGSNVQCSIAIAAFSGVKMASPLYGETGNANQTTGLQPGDVTALATGDLLITTLARNSVGTISIDSGYIIIDQAELSPGRYYGGALAYKIA